jgi:pimeloyl-ACP methyl ester carboxylesterase
MDSIFLTYKSSRVHYLKGGGGKRLLFCLHGYGESSGSFVFLEAPLGGEFTLIAIDLPFHGKTDWKEGRGFLPEDLLAIIREIGVIISGSGSTGRGRDSTAPGSGSSIAGSASTGQGSGSTGSGSASTMVGSETRGEPMSDEGRRGDLSAGGMKMYLMGYSMGGRLALSLVERIPEKIEKLVLVAPDGVKINIWYWLATQTRLGNTLFRFTMQKPGWFFLIVRLANIFRLVNQSVHKFTARYIDNAKVRNDLYLRWTTLRKFRPDIPKIKQIISQNKIRVRLLYGQYDRIILATTGEQFTKGIEDHCRLVVAPGGHQLLQPKNLETIVSLLND